MPCRSIYMLPKIQIQKKKLFKYQYPYTLHHYPRTNTTITLINSHMYY